MIYDPNLLNCFVIPDISTRNTNILHLPKTSRNITVFFSANAPIFTVQNKFCTFKRYTYYVLLNSKF